MLILFATFVLFPFFRSIVYSFQDWNGISNHIHWAGWSNYLRMMKDQTFARTIIFTVEYTVTTAIAFNAFGLALAVAFNSRLATSNVLRTAFFLPTVMSVVIVGYLWSFIITNIFPEIGRATGIVLLQSNWLVDPTHAFWSTVMVTVWQGIGYYIIIYLAGLQSVPVNLLEAAEMDGAGRGARFRQIVLPMIRPSATICLFLSVVNGFKSFDINYSLTMGGPYGTTQSISFQMYQDAFSKNLFSYASAEAVVFFIILSVLSLVQVSVMKRREVGA